MADRVIRGILGTKLGMTQVFDETNRVVPVTVVKAGPCVVTQVRTPDVDGYSAVQLAFGEIDPRKVPRPLRGHFEKAGVTPRRHVVELRTLDAASYPVGYELTAAAFSPGTVVDVIATSKGKGYAGVMKRHGFKGLGAGHGVEKKHRSPGSIGGCATPGRVFKGVKMAGRMGGERSTTMNLVVYGVDVERGLLLVRGAIPGPTGALVMVRSAAKRVSPDAFEPAAPADAAAGATEASEGADQ
jgi:large subunit ribosomal protein L3